MPFGLGGVVVVTMGGGVEATCGGLIMPVFSFATMEGRALEKGEGIFEALANGLLVSFICSMGGAGGCRINGSDVLLLLLLSWGSGRRWWKCHCAGCGGRCGDDALR